MGTRACRIPGMNWPKLAGKEFCSKLALDMQTRKAMKLSPSDLKKVSFFYTEQVASSQTL